MLAISGSKALQNGTGAVGQDRKFKSLFGRWCGHSQVKTLTPSAKLERGVVFLYDGATEFWRILTVYEKKSGKWVERHSVCISPAQDSTIIHAQRLLRDTETGTYTRLREYMKLDGADIKNFPTPIIPGFGQI